MQHAHYMTHQTKPLIKLRLELR